MDKEYFLSTANNLLEEAVLVRSYWQVIQQMHRNTEKYADEINCSPAFYNTIYRALIDSLFMCLSKLYDWNDRSITLRTLICTLDDISEGDLAPVVYDKYQLCGNTFQLSLSDSEEEFFTKEVEENKRIIDLLGIKDHPTIVEISLSQLLSLYKRRFEKLQERKLIPNLIEHRNKIFAHNDSKTNFNYQTIWNRHPLTDLDIEALVDFAADFLQCYIELLTGVQRATEYTNIDDWEATLKLTRLGMEHLCSTEDVFFNEP